MHMMSYDGYPEKLEMARISFRRALILLVSLTLGQIVILGLLHKHLYVYIPSENDDVNVIVQSPTPPLVEDLSKDVQPSEPQDGHFRRNTCNFTKVCEPPSLPLLLHFPALRECKHVSIPEKIGTNFVQFGTFLLEDIGGQKVNIIQYEMKDRLIKVTTKILQKWLTGEGVKPITWTTLIQVLERASLHTLSDNIKMSCDLLVMDVPFEGYTFEHITPHLTVPLRNIYGRINPIDPTQNLLHNLGNLSFNLPFVMPELSIDKDFDDVLTDLKVGSRLLITGRPGVGKSTLARYTAKVWADKLNLNHCQLLLYIPLLETMTNLKTLINVNTHGVLDQGTTRLVIEEMSNTMGKGVCLVLDSFDEYRPHLDIRIDYISKLIQRTVLPEATIIMTSRPEAVTDGRKYFHTHIEINGFTNEQIQSYITKLPSSLRVTIETTLEKNPHAWFMCSIPLHMTMLVRLASVDVSRLSDVTTTTTLYLQFLFLTFKQYSPFRVPWTAGSLKECFVNKLSQSELCFLFRNVCKLAWESNVKKESSFNSTALPPSLRAKVEALSLFTIDTKIGSVEDDNVYVYYFSHKTFHEFIAACHLYMLPLEDQSSELYSGVTASYWEVSVYHPVSIVWRFFFGILGKYDQNSLLVHFKYLSHTHRHCCNMSMWPDEERFNVEEINKQLLECAYEGEMDVSLTKIVTETNVLMGPEFSDEFRISLERPNDCLLIEYALRVVPFQRLVLYVRYYESYKYLNWVHCTSIFQNIEKHQEKYTSVNLREIRLIFPDVSPTLTSLVKILLSVISTAHLRVVELYVRNENDLMQWLQIFSVRKIESLTISQHKVVVNGETLSKTLKMFVDLKHFNLECSLDSLGIIDISETLTWMTDLQTLQLAIGDIDQDVITALSSALMYLHQLRVLIIKVDPMWWLHKNIPSNTYKVLSNSSVLALQAEGFRHLTLLEHLRLECHDRDEPFHCNQMLMGLLNLKYLTKLELFYNLFDMKEAYLIADHLQQKRLEYLDISSNIISNQARSAFDKSIQGLHNLKFLKLSANHIKGYMPLITGGFKQLTQLCHLSLSFSVFGKSAAALAELKHLTQLVELDLSWNHMGESPGVPELAHSLKFLRSLKYLNLRQNYMEQSSGIILESLGNVPSLVKIDYSNNKLDTIGAEALAKSLKNLTSLTQLILTGTNLGDIDLRTLSSAFEHTPQLRHLHLSWNDLRDDGVKTLAGGLKYLINLETLKLSYNQIRCQGALHLMRALQNTTTLEYLNLRGNIISTEGIDALREGLKHLPNLKPIRITHQEEHTTREYF